MLTIAIANALIVANGARLGTGPSAGTDPLARLLWQRSSRTVRPVIPLPWIEEERGRTSRKADCVPEVENGWRPALNAPVRESRHHATFYILYYSADRRSDHNWPCV